MAKGKKGAQEDSGAVSPEELAVSVLLAQLGADIKARNELERQNGELRRERDRQEHERLMSEHQRLQSFLTASAKQNRLMWLLVAVLVLGLLQLLGVNIETIGKLLAGLRGART